MNVSCVKKKKTYFGEGGAFYFGSNLGFPVYSDALKKQWGASSYYHAQSATFGLWESREQLCVASPADIKDNSLLQELNLLQSDLQKRQSQKKLNEGTKRHQLVEQLKGPTHHAGSPL